jgi:hypothetical protein
VLPVGATALRLGLSPRKRTQLFFFQDAHNTLVERLHRRPAIGRIAFLFVGSHAGGERAAIAYSVLGTCRLIGLNPVPYLADVLPVLARGIEADELPALMPKAWKLAHPRAAVPPQR